MMSGSYKIEGCGSENRGYNGATSGVKFNNQGVPVFLDSSPIKILRANDNFLNGSHTDVLPVFNRLNFDAQVQSSEGDSAEDLDFSDAVLKYINHILLEEDVEEKACMFQVSEALQAAEKSSYEIIGEQYPASRDYKHVSNLDQIFGNTDEKLSGVNDCCNSCHTVTLCPDWNCDPNCNGLDRHHATVNIMSQSTSQSSYGSSSRSSAVVDGPIESPLSTPGIPDIFGDSQSAMQFKKGVEEARKFLPSGSNLIATLGYDDSLLKDGSAGHAVKVGEKIDNDKYINVSRGKKNPYHMSMGLEEERSNKQSAVYSESIESRHF